MKDKLYTLEEAFQLSMSGSQQMRTWGDVKAFVNSLPDDQLACNIAFEELNDENEKLVQYEAELEVSNIVKDRPCLNLTMTKVL